MPHLSGSHVSRITGEHSQIIDGEPVFMADAAVCGGTGDHEGQDVDSCDECPTGPATVSPLPSGELEEAFYAKAEDETGAPVDRDRIKFIVI